MTTYTRTETVEAMQWKGWRERDSRVKCALEIVAWVKEQGGEARYEPGRGTPFYEREPCIAVRQANGEMAYAAPGDVIVMGDKWFHPYPDGNRPPSERRAVLVFSVVPAAAWESQGWRVFEVTP